MCTIMFATLILITTLGTSLAGYAGSSSNDVSSGYGYGYSGSYSGNGGNIPPPSIPNIPNFDFGGLLNGYFDSFKKYHEHFINTLQQQAAQAAAQNPGYAAGFSTYGAPQGGSYSGGAGDGGAAVRGSYNGGAGDGGAAVASASLGPQGGYQTAAVYPENPVRPPNSSFLLFIVIFAERAQYFFEIWGNLRRGRHLRSVHFERELVEQRGREAPKLPQGLHHHQRQREDFHIHSEKPVIC
jgi:hypothetical protein